MSQIIKLNLPTLSVDKVRMSTAGLRPHRTSGIRFEEEIIKDKSIYHNYGHGGAGVSMSYGCSSIMASTMQLKNPKKHDPKVAVIGSGYMGIFTAKILAEKGYSVKVYTKALPFQNERGAQHIASEAAGGWWFPYGYVYDETNERQKELHNAASKITYDYFASCIKENKYKGIRYIDCVFPQQENFDAMKKFMPESIDFRVQKQLVQINNGEPFPCTTFRSIMIEGHIVIPQLILESMGVGVEFVNKEFKSVDDVLELPEKQIFNCLGLKAGEVFNDKDMIAYKGQLAWFPTIPEIPVYFNYRNRQGESVTTYPHTHYTGIGLTRVLSDDHDPTTEQHVTQKLVDNFNEMVQEFSQPARLVAKL